LSPSTDSIADVVRTLTHAADDASWSDAFRRGFSRLRGIVDLHPGSRRPAETCDAAAATARTLAAASLPRARAVVMHLYPLAALGHVPLPWWSAAGRRRARLLREVHGEKLILANAGSERAAGAHEPVNVARVPGGVRVDGTYDYVSLAHVADVVLFSAPLAGSRNAAFCAADLRAPGVAVGAGKFGGGMRLADTCSLTFADHFVPAARFIEIPTEAALGCMTQYQRGWFHLLIGEVYLSRIEQLHREFALARTPAHLATLEELSHLRAYSWQLLDAARSPDTIGRLARVTALFKLRVSGLAQATADAVRPHDESAANELGFLRRQPTSDERILASLADRVVSERKRTPIERAVAQPYGVPPNYLHSYLGNPEHSPDLHL
jgi:alkylation response protein AidB-like acyl-CoA dehydrogenase